MSSRHDAARPMGELGGTTDAEVAPSFVLIGESEQQQPPILDEESEDEHTEEQYLELGGCYLASAAAGAAATSASRGVKGIALLLFVFSHFLVLPVTQSQKILRAASFHMFLFFVVARGSPNERKKKSTEKRVRVGSPPWGLLSASGRAGPLLPLGPGR